MWAPERVRVEVEQNMKYDENECRKYCRNCVRSLVYLRVTIATLTPNNDDQCEHVGNWLVLLEKIKTYMRMAEHRWQRRETLSGIDSERTQHANMGKLLTIFVKRNMQT